MEISPVEFLKLDDEARLKYFKENNIKVHPYVWMMLSDKLRNTLNAVHFRMNERVGCKDIQTITTEDGNEIIAKCNELKAILDKMYDGLVPSIEDKLND